MVKPAAQNYFRKYRRGRARNKRIIDNDVQILKDDNKCSLYHLNIRGMNSKKNSMEKILKTLSPQIVTLNETALRFKVKPKLENFVAFNRNRHAKIMGGVATFVNEKDKDSFVKLAEGENDDEFLITRHSNFLLPLNIINVYGEQENRASKVEIQDRWGRLLLEIKKIENRNELLLIIGDLNKKIGNDAYGVKGNHNKISFGGELVRSLLYNGEYVCLNNCDLATGGPFTRFDPSCPDNLENMSCIDLVLASNRLVKFIDKFEIDSGRKFSPIRPISKKKSITSDHFPILITFSSDFCSKKTKVPRETFTIWNTNKEGGWNRYKEMTNDDISILNEDDILGASTTEVMSKLDKKINKIKYSAFGKVKRKKDNPNKNAISTIIENEPEELLKLQRVEVEKEFKKIDETKNNKGKTAAIFNTLKKIRGDKKATAELVAMKHPENDELIFDPEVLKSVSLDYCVNLLQNSKCDKDFEKEIYVENLVHYLRMKEDDIVPNDLKEEDFLSRLGVISKKQGEKYKFILKAGEGFKNCIFNLFKQVWECEQKPKQWRNTILIQLFKGKGSINEFSTQRFIHTKEEIPKLFEGIVVDKSKFKIISKCSKFQIGGMPHHRSQENLFTVKSVISLYSMLKIPLFMQIYDISKYFDKEILKDAMDTLYRCGVQGKLYRLWYTLYKDSQIKVKTAAGMTEIRSTGENVTQGSIGGAILSSANLDKTLSIYFGGSDCEVSYGDVRLRPITFQDDTSRLVRTIEDAQKGNIFMEAAMKRKQLSLNISKCSLIVFEKKKRIEAIRKSINQSKSLKIGQDIIKAKIKDDYLGDVIHEEGLEKSVEATIAKRYGRIFSSLIEVSAILDDFRIDSIGGMKAGLEIYELAILPSLLNNSDVWIEMGKTSIDKLNTLQNTMFRYLFAVPEGTPLPLLRFDLGSLSMAERVAQKKLNFIHHLIKLRDCQESESLAGEVFDLQARYGFPGLVSECSNLINNFGLPNIIQENLCLSKIAWKNTVKTCIKETSEKSIKKEFEKYSKLVNKDFEKENLEVKDYVKSMKLRDARTLFRIRSGMINVKMNMKNNLKYSMDLWRCDDCRSMDSQSHIIWCPAYAELREGKDISCDRDLVTYYQQVLKLREDNA